MPLLSGVEEELWT